VITVHPVPDDSRQRDGRVLCSLCGELGTVVYELRGPRMTLRLCGGCIRETVSSILELAVSAPDG